MTPVKPPAELYARNVPNMDSVIVTKIQQALAAKGFSPGDIDGDFGPETEAAVVAFQLSEGLVADGQVGRDTAGALGISLTGETPPEAAKPVEKPPEVAKPVEKPPEVVRPLGPDIKPILPDLKPILPVLIPKIPSILLGAATMNPLIALAATVLPDILKAVVGDKAGTVAGAVTQAVAQVTQTQDPEQARNKLNADPGAVVALQLKLAEIAADQDEKRQQAQLALIKEQNEQESKRRQADPTQLRVEMEDTRSARSTFSELALANNPMAWGAPVVSFIVTLGFFGILTLLIVGVTEMKDGPVAQIINITVGALAAAFATVVSFWLGSSQGSRTKDAATIQLQAEHVESQVRQTQMLQNTVQAQVKQAQALQSTMQTAIAAAPAVDAPKTSNFRRCLDIVWAQQRAYADAPGGPPSGATQFGVTLGLLRDWRQNQNLTDDDVRKLDRDEACEIYRTRYWNVLRCDDLPTGVDLAVFDFGVDAGPGQAARALQQVVGAQADSSVGPATVAATKVMDAKDVAQELSDRRLEYYRNQPNAANSIRAWTNRTNAVEKAALDMIAAE